MRQYYSDYATQDAFEFYAQDEWNHREDPSEDDDYEDWVEMHFDEIEVQPIEPTSSPPPQKTPPPAQSPPKHTRPSREEREELMVYRQFDRTKKKRGPKQDKEPKAPKPMKRKPGKPPRGAKSHTEVIESSLFSIIRLENPEP